MSDRFSTALTVADFQGPCPVCEGEVKGYTCSRCGWDEFGGNVFMSKDWEDGYRRENSVKMRRKQEAEAS